MVKSCFILCAIMAAIVCCSAEPKPLVVASAYTVPAASAHVIPGSPFVTGYSSQSRFQVARSGAIVAAPAVAYASPYAAHYASPYVAAPAYYV